MSNFLWGAGFWLVCCLTGWEIWRELRKFRIVNADNMNRKFAIHDAQRLLGRWCFALGRIARIEFALRFVLAHRPTIVIRVVAVVLRHKFPHRALALSRIAGLLHRHRCGDAEELLARAYEHVLLAAALEPDSSTGYRGGYICALNILAAKRREVRNAAIRNQGPRYTFEIKEER